jgi:phosphoglycerol transferase MdoB-like AlkP superfamily enzyme
LSETRNRTVRAFAGCALGIAVAAAALVALVYGMDPAFRPGHGAAGDFGLAALNALPVTLLVVLILALTRRALLACWSGALLIILLYVINALKLRSLDTPLLPADFTLIGQFGAGYGLLGHYIPSNARHLENYALGALLTLLLFAIPWRLAMSPRLRASLALGAFAIGASLVAGIGPWQRIYSSERLGFESWAPATTADHAGLLASLLRYHWEFSAPLPEPNRAAAAMLVAWHSKAGADPAPAAPGASEQPDIVVLQSESFFDPARLKGLDVTQVEPALRQLDTRSTHGDLWVPTYGGGTIRTEFEVLTGIGLRYFPASQYPYYDLATRTLPSLASVLAAHGYRTLVVHPNNATFWNRAAALKTLGFAGFDDETTFVGAPHEGYYISDAALVDHILARLGDSGPPTFIFAISMENHGPYDESPGIDARRRDAESVPPGVPHDAAANFRNYLYHLDNADHALGRLAEALAHRNRRSLLLFYGDHLPALPRVYASVGFDDGAAETAQPVPYLLFDTAHQHGTIENTASFFLGAELLAAAGIHEQYFDVLDAVRAETRFDAEFTPAEDAYLGALMQMRQRNEWPSAHDMPSGRVAAPALAH